ncbi:ABC transporter substrate-binding protein [Psychrilyobacter sp.]|uniref:ABC transporter substrate-binding protein n=1 Tax=Psychrilyobacter sp. TaxID=2586924 RepID=UPI003016641A
MSKIIIYFLLFISSYSINHVNINKLDVQSRNGTVFMSMNSFSKIGVDLKRSKNTFILNTDLGKYYLIDNRIITPQKEYTYLSIPFISQEKYYLPLELILELNGAYLKNNKIIRSVEPKNPNIFPKRIISLSPGITEKIFALGGEDLLVGRTSFSTYPEEVKNIDIVGTMFEPNLEIILDKDPDTVIAETHFRKKLMSTLNSLGISVTKYQTPINIPEIHRSIVDLGVLLGRHLEARGLNASLKDKINYTRYILRDQEVPKVYYVLGSGKTDITPGGDTFINSLMVLAGGENIAKEKNGWRYSLEELILNNPDIIFGSQRNIDNMLMEENYYFLTAIKNKNHYIIPDDSIFNLPGPRALTQGIYEMVKIFHPESAKKLKPKY